MIETVENAAQLAVVSICGGVSLYRAIRRRSRLWVLMTLFYGTFLLGLLYWLLYLMFYGMTPQFRYISEMSWYTAYVFLIMILKTIADPGERSVRKRSLLLCPVFAAGMAVLYMQFSSWLSNICSAAIMSLLMYHAARGLIYHRKKPQHGVWSSFYRLMLLFCASEYLMWTSTCFYWSETLENPYFWFDILQTVCFFLIMPAVERAEQSAKAVTQA